MAALSVPVKPNIVINATREAGIEAKIREIQAGIEEEGVPWVSEYKEGLDALLLAYQAACTSALGVGIGVSGDEICIHYAKLPQEKPLFSIKAGGISSWRCCGYNAARLVKGVYFKEIGEDSMPQPESVFWNIEKNEIENLAQRVAELVRQYLADDLTMRR